MDGKGKSIKKFALASTKMHLALDFVNHFNLELLSASWSTQSVERKTCATVVSCLVRESQGSWLQNRLSCV